MIRLLQLLIYGHIHEWETMKVIQLSDSYDQLGVRVHLRCKKCGDYKKRDLI